MSSERDEKDILKIVKERQELESKYNLSKRLYNFIEFSRWGAREKIEIQDFLRGMGGENGIEAQTAWKVDFSSHQNTYSILLYRKESPSSGDDSFEEMLEIYSNDKHRVFSASISLKWAEEVPVKIYRSSHLVAFKPNGWLDDLLLILDEEDKLDAKRREEEEKKRLQKLKNNFL